MDRQLILIVEVEKNRSSQLGEVLVDAGYEVTVQDPACDILARIRPNWPSLLVLGMTPSDQLALPLIQSIRSDVRLRELPIVVIGDQTTKNDMLAVLESGADDYLIKPFGPRELVARVGALLRRWHSTRGTGRTGLKANDEITMSRIDDASNDSGVGL